MSYRDEVLRNCPAFDNDTLREKLALGGLGTAGESGEAATAAVDFLSAALGLAGKGAAVADLIKKVNHHSLPLEEAHDKLVKEMGDVHWYLEYLAASIGVTTEQVLAANVEKLRRRHPHGWTPESQRAKADELNPAEGK